MSTTMPNYTGWMKEVSDEENRDGQAAGYERFIGKHMAKSAIAEYDDTWKGDHGHELTTRKSARKYANGLAEAQTAIR